MRRCLRAPALTASCLQCLITGATELVGLVRSRALSWRAAADMLVDAASVPSCSAAALEELCTAAAALDALHAPDGGESLLFALLRANAAAGLPALRCVLSAVEAAAGPDPCGEAAQVFARHCALLAALLHSDQCA